MPYCHLEYLTIPDVVVHIFVLQASLQPNANKISDTNKIVYLMLYMNIWSKGAIATYYVVVSRI